MQDIIIDCMIFGIKCFIAISMVSILLLIPLLVIVKLVGSGSSNKGGDAENAFLKRVKIVNLTKEYRKIHDSVAQGILSDKDYKKLKKDQKLQDSESKKNNAKEEPKKRLFVLNFDGDVTASQADILGKQIDAILSIADPADEVMLRLNSPGGSVVGYGLAASQLMRLRSRGIRLTVCVDEMAASGGYMMACVANYIVCAPFAVVGSIGVVAEFPNFHRLLDKMNIDYEQQTAGKYKRTLTLFGDNTDPEARAKFKKELEDCHNLFKNHVSKYRPQLKIDEIATGEFWYGVDAIQLHLVDEICTSNEFITSKLNYLDVFEFRVKKQKSLKDKLLSASTFLYQAANRML